MNRIPSFYLYSPFLFGNFSLLFSSGVGGYSASNTFTVTSGNATNQVYQIGSASISGDPVYVGVVSSYKYPRLLFATGTDENNDLLIHCCRTWVVFNPNAQIPKITAVVSGAVTDDCRMTYPGGFDNTGSGFLH